jgi:hypothetical protein
MADGTQKPIEDVRVGDAVRTGPAKVEVATVAEVLAREAKEVCTVEFKRALQTTGSASASEKITATVEHEFWVDGRGWTSVAQLAAGDWLSNSDGTRSQVTAIKRLPGKAKVFTFVNRNDHAFYANGILVRDSCGDKSALYQQTKPSVPELKEVAR